jgi:methionine-rich copper-binding protein CopC
MTARLVLACLLAALIAPAAAAAHATSVETTPGDTAVLQRPPRVVSLKWSEPVDLGGHAIRLRDGAGDEIATPGVARPGPGGKSTIVRWIQQPGASAERPAPVLQLGAPPAGWSGGRPGPCSPSRSRSWCSCSAAPRCCAVAGPEPVTRLSSAGG